MACVYQGHQEAIAGEQPRGARLCCCWRQGKGPWERREDEIQHKVSSGAVLGPAVHPQLSAPTSIFTAALLLGWAGGPMGSKATELRSPEQAPPCGPAQLPCS